MTNKSYLFKHVKFPNNLISNISKPRMNIVKLNDIHAFQDHLKQIGSAGRLLEKELANKGNGKKKWYVDGICDVCDAKSSFLLDWNYSDGTVPNFRERMVCQTCNLNNRQRFMGMLIKKIISCQPKIKIYLYEQVTPFYQFMKALTHTVKGSEYLGWDMAPGQIVNDIRNENALQLSFSDGEFDVIISNDVFEHVPDIKLALQESVRTLQKDGILLVSIPFHINKIETVQRAEITDSKKIINLLPEQYHGNPISEKGSLVFYDYGWNFLDFCKDAGFEDAYVLGYYSTKHCHVGGNGFQSIIVAEKTKGKLDKILDLIKKEP